MSIAVVILTYNEELHLARAIESVSSLSEQIFVVDSGSTDLTVDIARKYGATVLVHPFVNQAQQMRWALDNAQITAEWVMRLDADEVIESDLAIEISRDLPLLPADVGGVNLRRKHVFMGRWLRHGGRFPVTLLRIWRRGDAEIEQRWMDEHMVLTRGRTVTFYGGFADVNLQDLTHFTAKHNSYATREAIDVLSRKYDLAATDGADLLSSGNSSASASLKRWIKKNVYNRMPLWLGPLSYFLFRFVLQLGFLDGRPGVIYHGLQGGWYRFLVAAKVAQWDAELKTATGRNARLERLSRLTGYQLEKMSGFNFVVPKDGVQSHQ
ncbi:glycosyltransferase family 2 protein [Caulobacter sp. 73W]|uniref:Glycosyltransferase family 2 protein n=1 Tax=Caulobacter sp. 73W TaxID=3161137 RepID=A0AB39KYK6_9CAUL